MDGGAQAGVTGAAEALRAARAGWEIPPAATATLINVSENLTYRLEADGWRRILRVHRPGYHSRAAIESELAWLAAVGSDTGLSVAAAVPGRGGRAVQEADLDGPRHLALFTPLPGRHVAPGEPMVPMFRRLGAQTAQLHAHARGWARPAWFERFAWDERAVFGPRATWGDWRAAPGVTAAVRAVLERAERAVTRRLAAHGKGAGRYGLIHADLRLANVLVEGGRLHLLDFDDCGFGWFAYDFAAAVSFMEDDPRIPALRAAWLAGYRAVAPLSGADAAMIDSFVMFRRFALLAWIGSHAEAPEPQALAPHFADGTARLATRYLETGTICSDTVS